MNHNSWRFFAILNISCLMKLIDNVIYLPNLTITQTISCKELMVNARFMHSLLQSNILVFQDYVSFIIRTNGIFKWPDGYVIGLSSIHSIKCILSDIMNVLKMNNCIRTTNVTSFSHHYLSSGLFLFCLFKPIS